MRFVFLILCMLLAGCKHTPDSGSAKSSGQSRATRPNKPPREGAVQAQAFDEPAGKVASVNANLRFVVVDFSLNPLPKLDQQLGIYRNGQKVGVVKISAQARNNLIAADIMDGDAQ